MSFDFFKALKCPFFQVGQNLGAAVSSPATRAPQSQTGSLHQQSQQPQQHFKPRPPMQPAAPPPVQKQLSRQSILPSIGQATHAPAAAAPHPPPATKKSAPRKRWGASDSWNDWDSFDTDNTTQKKPFITEKKDDL